VLGEPVQHRYLGGVACEADFCGGTLAISISVVEVLPVRLISARGKLAISISSSVTAVLPVRLDFCEGNAGRS